MPNGTNEIGSHRIAMLIDGDNAQPALIEKMLIEANKYGAVIIRRIYGDWTDTSPNSWKKVLPNHAIQPVQQFRYTTGKNSTDSALIIDAMDLLYARVADCFCIVSSGSDYTRLATRIRESGCFVIGIGRAITPKSFRVACDAFVFTENLDIDSGKTVRQEPPNQTAKSSESEPDTKPDPLSLLLKAFGITEQEDGWALLSSLGNALRQIDPSFDPRTYGFGKISALLKAYTGVFRLDETTRYVSLVESLDGEMVSPRE